jgi:chemotaxis protein MotB
MANHFRKRSKNEGNTEDWLVTYADAITLILCFFVIIISVSEPKPEEFSKLKSALLMELSESKAEIEQPFEELYENIAEFIAQNQLEGMMSVEQTESGIVLELASSSFYKSGSAEFNEEAIPIIREMSHILRDFEYEDYLVDVEGHTDDVPISNARYPSNWELSANRATGIVRFFIDEGQERKKMRVKAFADVVPKVPNLDEFGNPIPENRELNRRIVITVEQRMD